jgi:alpha-D-ribose 1-methylphosphonate 5-triphosphate synthase subunit PhnH
MNRMQRETLYDPVFDAQEHYRLLLDAMARPGTLNVLPRLPLTPPPGLSAAAALIGFALLDANVSFHVEGDDAAVTRYLVVNTSATPGELIQADFVFAGGMTSPALVGVIKKGTLAYPDEGATLVIDVEALAGEAAALRAPALALTLRGPGVAGEKTFFVGGLSAPLLDALRECNAEFPLGIDLILSDPGHRIACIPRTSEVRWTFVE